MYMRFLQLKSKSANIEVLTSFYNSIAIPQLQKIPGCLFAGLVQSSTESNELISMTIWDTQENADGYEKSGVYQKLVEQMKPFLAESTEWKIQLSENLKLEYLPVPEEPVLKEYTIAAQSDFKQSNTKQSSRMYVRIVSSKIQKGKTEEFKRIYRDEIIPVLKTIKGCRYAYLSESLHEGYESLSITIWDSKEDAENYEKSGRFGEMIDKVKHTFSQFYRWKMALEKNTGGQIKTSEDLNVNKYRLVSGKSFK